MQRWRDATRWLIRCLASVLLAAACLACGDDVPPAASLRFPTIVLIGVDGMRGDHMSRSGYPRPTTPFLDALAERSVAFERAYSASSRSATSYASLLSGVAPGQHGVWEKGDALPAELPTLAEGFAERGYTTAAFVSTRKAWIPSGLVRGFDHIAQPGPLYERSYRRGGETVDAALAWLAEQAPGQPLFLWIQLEDTRKPFDPLPNPTASAGAGIDPKDVITYKLERHRVPFGYFNFEDRQLLRLVNRYDGELRGVDDALSRLYARMGAGGGAGALWVVTSPYGMGLGNHLWDAAVRQIYEVQVRVPLFFHTPGGELAARTSETVVSQFDFGSVLLALADGSDEPLEELFATATESPGGAFVQRGALRDLTRDTGRIGQPLADTGQLDAWVESRWKLLRHSDGSEEVFDVAQDPYETLELGTEVPAVELERLRAALAEQHELRGLIH
jgi:arylsulfatase